MTNKTDQELDSEIAELQKKLNRLTSEKESRSWPKNIKFYVHSDKDSNSTYAAELGLSEEAEREFRYTGLEITLDIRVEEDGKAYVLALNGIDLESPAEL